MSLTFDDAVDDTVTDDGPATPLDNLYALMSGELSDGDLVPGERTCVNVGAVGTALQLAESLDCDVPATVYVSSPRLDEGKFYSVPEIQELDGMGHEIGGHSAHHMELPKLESSSENALVVDEQRFQVCWDRSRLSLIPKRTGSGTLDVVSFAYAYGEYSWTGDPALIDRSGAPDPTFLGSKPKASSALPIPSSVPTRARTTTGSANTPACTDGDTSTPCNWAESTTPPDPFALRAASSVTHSTPIDYPVVPVNDDGKGVYDRTEEFEGRAKSVKGWNDNAIAHPPTTG